MAKALASVDQNKLASWLDRICPKVLAILEANNSQRAFDSYEVFWDEEREDINEVHAIRTDFDFKEANKAVQKALNQLSAAAGEDKTQASFNEWGDSSATQSN